MIRSAVILDTWALFYSMRPVTTSATPAPTSSGQFQFHLPGAGSYYLSTDSDAAFHALIDECWDDVQCPDRWDPIAGGADLIAVAADTTVVADFTLDSQTFTLTGRDHRSSDDQRTCFQRRQGSWIYAMFLTRLGKHGWDQCNTDAIRTYYRFADVTPGTYYHVADSTP